ncbi:MAG: Wadjet anti-phage system protein JetA family protein [Faecalibacillus faecis]
MLKEDIGGKINDIIKEGQECPEVFDQVATISINKYLIKFFIFTTTNKKVKNTDLILDTQLDEQTRLMAIEKLKQNEKYTKTAIEKNVLQCLINEETILGSNYYDQNKDLSLFILTWLYGYSQNARYKIEPQENIIKKDHYQFREFIIRRVEDE